MEGIVNEKDVLFNDPRVQSAINAWIDKGLGRNPVKRLKYGWFVTKSLLKGNNGDTNAVEAQVHSSFWESMGVRLHEVWNNAHKDAKRMYIEAQAREHIAGMYATINPTALATGQLIATLLIGNSFSSVPEVTGLDQTVAVPGRGEVSLSQILSEGSVEIIPTHRMYFDVPLLPYVFGKNGINSVYYFAGKNVPEMKSKAAHKVALQILGTPLLAAWKYLFVNSGAILFDRNLENKKVKGNGSSPETAEGESRQASRNAERRLVMAIAQAKVSYLLTKGANLMNFAGGGRHREGRIEPLDSILTNPGIKCGRYFIPVTITPDVVPEDYAFAVEHEKGGQTMLPYLLKYANREHRYGKIRVHFCHPLSTAEYPSKNIMEEEVTRRLIANTPLIPTTALSATLKLYHIEEFNIPQISSLVEKVVNTARDHNVRIADELQDKNVSLQTVLYKAAMALTGKKQMLKMEMNEFKLREPRLRDFYANMALQTLDALGAVKALSIQPAHEPGKLQTGYTLAPVPRADGY